MLRSMVDRLDAGHRTHIREAVGKVNVVVVFFLYFSTLSHNEHKNGVYCKQIRVRPT